MKTPTVGCGGYFHLIVNFNAQQHCRLYVFGRVKFNNIRYGMLTRATWYSKSQMGRCTRPTEHLRRRVRKAGTCTAPPHLLCTSSGRGHNHRGRRSTCSCQHRQRQSEIRNSVNNNYDKIHILTGADIDHVTFSTWQGGLSESNLEGRSSICFYSETYPNETVELQIEQNCLRLQSFINNQMYRTIWTIKPM